MDAIIYYTNTNIKVHHPEYPIYSKLEFTLNNILKLRKITNREIVITDLEDVWTFYTEGVELQEQLKKYEPNSVGYIYLTSFPEEELKDMNKHPEKYMVLEIFNSSYRE